MRAKTVNESKDFERGQDPKKAMGLGWDMDKYIEAELQKKGKGDVDFWDEFYEGMRSMYNVGDMTEMLVDMLEHTSPEHQKQWADNFLDLYHPE